MPAEVCFNLSSIAYDDKVLFCIDCSMLTPRDMSEDELVSFLEKLTVPSKLPSAAFDFVRGTYFLSLSFTFASFDFSIRIF